VSAPDRLPDEGDAPDFAARGLLDGLEGAARESRAKLLESLYDDGCSPDELESAVAEGRLALLPAELALGGIGQLTAAEVAERAGVDVEALEAVRRAAGLPLPPRDVAALGELDLFGARALAAFIRGGLPLDGLVEASRVFGEAAAHAAAAAGTLANTAIPQEGDTEYDYAQRLSIATRELTPYAAELLGVMYMLHNRENIRQETAAADELIAGRRSDIHEVTVGFCDVVGFTRLGEGVAAADLGAIATRLAALAVEAAEPPVRLIKTIGDAAMFVAPEPAQLLDTVLCVMEAAEWEGEQFPSLHAGAAHGPALRRWGDYYGGPVNLAARLTERARASSLITDAAVRERAGDDGFAWSDAGLKKLKGFSEPTPVFRCRRAPQDGRGSRRGPAAG
jgi:adenylate cyclase